MDRIIELTKSSYEIDVVNDILETLDIKNLDRKIKLLEAILRNIMEREKYEQDEKLFELLLDNLFPELDYLESMVLFEKCLTILRLINDDDLTLILIDKDYLKLTENEEENFDNKFINELCGNSLISIANIVYFLKLAHFSPESVLTLNLESKAKEKKFSFYATASRLENAVLQYYDEIKEPLEEFLPLIEWKELLKIANANKRTDAIRYIDQYLLRILPSASTPTYMKTEVKKVALLPEDLKEAKQLALNIASQQFNIATDIAELGTVLQKFTNSLSTEELSYILSMERSNLVDDYDQIEGPENNMVFDGIVKPCLGRPSYRRKEGCRMLTCICVAEDTDDEEDSELLKMSWFTSKCEKCNVLIEHFSHALRLPLNNGGWVGCFCSENCAVEIANKEIKNVQGMVEYTKFNQIMANIKFKGIVNVGNIYNYRESE
jgi:hypothetical protein